MAKFKEVVVIGAGALGMAISYHLARLGLDVLIYDKSIERLHHIMKKGVHPMCPETQMPRGIKQVKTLDRGDKHSLYLLAIPSRNMVSALTENQEEFSPESAYVICSKGIDKEGLLLSQVAAKYLPSERIAILSGPNFAKDIMYGDLTVTNIACADIALAQEIARTISGNKFMAYPIDDVISVQLCGAYKNVLAIAVGILKSLGHLPNALAALVCYGIEELKILIKAFNGKEQTLLEPCGIGDIYLTCGSLDSRNTSFGMLVAGGMLDIKEYLLNNTVEGVEALICFHKIAKDRDLKLVIIDLLYSIIMENAAPNIITQFFVTS